MRYAIISDIHGNLQALESVLKDIDERNIDEIYCLGDVVGYGADPSPCVKIIDGMDIPCVMGNHDYVVSHDTEEGNGFLGNFNPEARTAVKWTREQLSDEQMEFLRELPYEIEISKGNILLFHASPLRPKQFEYLSFGSSPISQIYQRELIEANVDELDEGEVAFVGHTHIPMKVELSNRELKIERPESRNPTEELEKALFIPEEITTVKDCGKYIFNVGSVGQPRDRNPNARYVVYDENEKTVKYIELEYDVGRAAQRIREEGLPERLAKRLFTGK